MIEYIHYVRYFVIFVFLESSKKTIVSITITFLVLPAFPFPFVEKSTNVESPSTLWKGKSKRGKKKKKWTIRSDARTIEAEVNHG